MELIDHVHMKVSHSFLDIIPEAFDFILNNIPDITLKIVVTDLAKENVNYDK